MECRRGKRISAEEAIADILDFVNEASDEEESDIEELYGEENLNGDNANERNSDVESDSSSEEERTETPTERRKHRKKQLTYKRKVNSIESALSEGNYELLAIPEKEKILKVEVADEESNAKKKKDRKKTVEFTNIPQGTTGRQNACNIIPNKPGVAAGYRKTDNERDAFELLFTEQMVEKIVLYTNKRISETIEIIGNDIMESGKYPHVKKVDAIDIYAVIGLMYMRGLYGLNKHDLRLLFSDKRGIPIFGATMSRLRYQFIVKHLSFDDIETREERWKSDRFTAMRDIFEACNKSFGSALVPENFIALDETLYPTRNQISFKQYNPDKPAKYGLLFKSLNSARYPYTYQTHVYCGKPTGTPDEYYVQGTVNYIKYLVSNLAKYHRLDGRNITMDRLYSSFDIAEWLLDRKITMLGTMRSNRVGIPQYIKETKDKEILSSEIFWQKDASCNISNYTVKTSKGKKAVIVLSTLNPIRGVTIDDEKKKPALYKLYDFTKGGTDIVDQKMGFYSTKAKSRKWTMVAFCYLLDTLRVNSITLFSLNKQLKEKKGESFEHGYNLAEQLILPQIIRRSRKGLTATVLGKIDMILGGENKQQTNDKEQPTTPGRCKTCVSEIKGAMYSVNKSKVGKVKGFCAKCKNHCCNKHAITYCKDCS